jgi:phosphonoacetate hydrolase
MTSKKTRALIVVLDALRPEFVTPELMPDLNAFANSGVRYLNSRSTYPSETRVNQSAVTTGCYPRRHGVVANNFVFGKGADRRVVKTGEDVVFETTLNELPEPLFGVPTLGERLAAAGLSYATLSAGTPGGGRLINIAAEKTGFFRFAMRRPEAACPKGVFASIEKTVGPLPEYQRPALDWVSYAIDCYLDYVEPEISPDVMLLWLCEPDETFHFHGIGSDKALHAIRHADREFGRILARHEAAIASGEMHVIAMSDHGQIALEGEPLGLSAKLRDAGFGDGLEIAVSNAGGIWLPDADPARVQQVVAWLRQQDWCGPLFTRDGAGGTLKQSDILIDHRRAPDISLALRYDDRTNAWGRAGLSLHDSVYPDGGGSHGGLSPYEMHNVLAFGGARFISGCRVKAPGGNVDILPTVFRLLDIPVEGEIDGRVLSEAFVDGPDPDEVEISEKKLSSANAEGPKTYLSITEVGGTGYINRAWIAEAGGSGGRGK